MSSEERRAAILEAAIKMFAEKGFRGTTTRALADAVGVTEPVLYEHFRSKRDLYAAIVEAKSQEGMARGALLLEPYFKARNDRGLFIALGHLILACFAEDPAWARLFLSAALEDPELGRLFYDRQQPARECLAGYIAQRIADGAFRPVEPALAARAFFGMLSHHGMSRMLYADDFVKGTVSETVEGMVDIFLSGLSNHR